MNDLGKAIILITSIAGIWVCLAKSDGAAMARRNNESENGNQAGVIGTVESFNRETGVLRVRDATNNVLTYLVTVDTTVLEEGEAANPGKIENNDPLTVYVRKDATNNELGKVELHDE